jgi:cell division septal protein FtsQ
MKDYKHVTVPRSYRTANRRTTTKRVNVGRGPARRGNAEKGALGAVLTVLLTAGLCYGGWETYRWLTTAEMFQIAGVDVRGVRSVSDAEIRDLAGIFTGQNVFRVDLDAATRRALANPWVREVRIERSLPNRISMIFTERVPRAVLQAANGRYLIDGEGVVMVPVPKDEAATSGLPVIAVRDCRAVPREAVTAGAVAEALELARELAVRGGWDPGAVTVKADSPETIAIVYADHEFRIGSGNYGEKLKRLGEIAADMRQRGLEYSYVELRPERQAAVMVMKNRGQGTGSRVKQLKKRT